VRALGRREGPVGVGAPRRRAKVAHAVPRPVQQPARREQAIHANLAP
jgi:hypothetical protein